MLLAPVPAVEVGGSGDLRPIFSRLRKAGFVRVRVEGQILDLEDPAGEAARCGRPRPGDPAFGRRGRAKPPHRHDHGAPGRRTGVTASADRDRPTRHAPRRLDRLIDSIRTALRWSRDEVWALVEDAHVAGGWREERFTTSFRNLKTGFRLPELTPRHFSFNSHQGACPACHGLGTQLECDPGLLVPDRSLSLAEGAVKSWWTGNPTMLTFEKQQLAALATHFHAPMELPFDKLPNSFQDALFHGTGPTAIKTGWKTWRHDAQPEQAV